MTIKKALIVVAWVSIVGSLGDLLITIYCCFLVVFETAVEVGISVELLIKNYLSFLYWIKNVAYYVLPESLVVWLFELAALIYFPIRVVTSLLIGWWLLWLAKRVPQS
ncbi:MAG: hypothetical protein KTR16_01555 [Acidiferrobacterales bacterium]|nr:hypothetical protein [Acidiferrobacterales bacterium]